MTRPRPAGALVLVCAGVLLAAAAAVRTAEPPPVKGLTHAPLLARAYDMVYDADFAGAEAELQRACGPAPAQACGVIGVAAQWWRIYLDIDNRSLDQAFTSRLNTVIAAGEQWAAREPERAEAWFYLGAAYGVRVQYHGQRLEFLAAARDGKRIKNSLEKALALDPGLDDANAGLGLYQVLRRCRAVGPEGAPLVPRAAGRRQGQGPRAAAAGARARRAPEGRGRLPVASGGPLVREQERRGARDSRRPPRTLSAQSDLPVERRAGRTRCTGAIAPPPSPSTSRSSTGRAAVRFASRCSQRPGGAWARRRSSSRWPSPTAPSTNCTR